ncbi:MAG TPA: hypothetical protein VJB57_17285 [Dehalococcoidia bacterium]|nr:hypothetical protein [Dehalococcoidia bacterium]
MKPLVLAVLLASAALVLLHGPAFAADPVVTDLRVDAGADLTVGDHFRYVIKVEVDRGTDIFLAAGGLPDPLELTKTPSARTRSVGGGRVEITLTIEVAAFEPGDLSIPPLTLRYRNAGGGSGDLETPPSRVGITSVLPLDGEVTPRDLKPQAEIGTPPAIWVLVAIAAALVALVVVVSLIIWRRRVLQRQPIAAEPELEVIPLSPEDRARAALDSAAREFAAARDFTAYYAAIGVTAREYLTERYGFAAFALTTSELQSEMQRRGLDRWQARLVAGLLTQCDSAVYAGYRPAHERADADLTAAYEIVEMSRPAPALVEVTAT